MHPLRILLALLFVLPAAALAGGANPLAVDIREYLSGTNFNGPFLRGMDGVLDVYFENCPGQACDPTERSSVYVQLPPGLSYVSHQGFSPTFVTCTAEAVTPQGQTVRCTGAGLSGNPLAITKFSAVRFDLAVAADAPLGPAPIVVAVDAQEPAASNSLALCLTDPAPAWCDVMGATIAVPPQPELRFTGGQFSPSVFAVGDDSGVVRANFRNAGEAAAAQVNVRIQLPRGAYWRSAGNASSPAGFNCSQAGTVDPGFVLDCRLAAPLASGAEGFLRIGLNAGVLVEGGLPVLFAIDAQAGGDPQVLDRCAQDPEGSDCLLIDVPLRNGCAQRHGLAGIYCDSYEAQQP